MHCSAHVSLPLAIVAVSSARHRTLQVISDTIVAVLNKTVRACSIGRPVYLTKSYLFISPEREKKDKERARARSNERLGLTHISYNNLRKKRRCGNIVYPQSKHGGYAQYLCRVHLVPIFSLVLTEKQKTSRSLVSAMLAQMGAGAWPRQSRRYPLLPRFSLH